MASLIALLGPWQQPAEEVKGDLEGLLAALTVEREENNRLRAQCESLTTRVAELEGQATPENPKSIASLYRIIVGIVEKHYRFQPEAKKNSATARIVDDVARTGHSISDETVLKHLRLAYRTFPPQR